MNTSYESVIIYNTNLDEAALDKQIESVEKIIGAHGGSLQKKEVWGKRELAYHIKKKKFGTYVELHFDGDSGLVSDLERQLNINTQVLRFLNVAKEEESATA